MRKALFVLGTVVLAVLLAGGCGSDKDKGKNKDKEKPRAGERDD